jgi:demethylmenaquinone methyltransferase / 2-methoxy-6-polyprenyl-1,4-benzoquinol methylase
MATLSPPPSSLRSGLSDTNQKQALVDWVFDRVAPRYDLGNHIMSAGWHTRWKRRLIDYTALESHHRVLDLAAGTGDVTFLAAELAGEVVGTDINPSMLELAQAKQPAHLNNIRWQVADVGALPFADNSFDRVTCAYAGRGFPDFPRAVHEIARVLKPGGVFWNLDFARPQSRTWDRVVRGYLTVSGAALGVALHGTPKAYVYIPESMRAYPGQRWLDGLIRDAGMHAKLVETRGTLMAFNQGIKP